MTRPNLLQVLEDDFFKGFTPNHLPISSLTMAPRFATSSSAHLLGVSRKPLNELNTQEQQTTGGRRDKAEFLEKVNKRRSLGIRVCGGESKLIQPGEAVAEELKDEDQDGMILVSPLIFCVETVSRVVLTGHLWMKLLILVPRLSSLYYFLNEICPHLDRECLPKNVYFL